MKFYNNNPDFGDAGPHEANSAEALADEMSENIDSLARTERIDAHNDDAMGDFGWDEWLIQRKSEMRAEFLRGLDVVE